MQQTSQAWRDNQLQNIRSASFVEVAFQIADPDALLDASASDNGSIYFSNTAETVDGVEKNVSAYSLMEHNIWNLDGSFHLLPKKNWGQTGFISEVLCDESHVFHYVPVVTVTFSEVHEKLIPGITITWSEAYDEFATDFIVVAYNGANAIEQRVVSGNRRVVSVVEMDVKDYDSFKIFINKWCLPIHRARIEDLLIGVGVTYRKGELISFTQESLSDPLAASLPKYTINYEVDNVDNSFDPNNVQGLTKYLIERQKIVTRYGYRLGDFDEIEWMGGGVYHLSEWAAPQNGITANFKARDILEFMTGLFNKGLYAPAGASLYSLAESVLLEAPLPLHPDGGLYWHIDDSLKGIYTTAPLPRISLAGCLQLIANASCCAIRFERNGRLRIEPLTDEVTDYEINLFNSFEKTEIEMTKPLAGIEFRVSNYFAADMSSELFNGNVTVNGTQKVLIVYSQPAVSASLVVTGATVVSVKYYTHVCELVISGSGNAKVVVTGVQLNRSEADYQLETGSEGEILPLQNPLITSYERAEIVAEHAKRFLASRRILSSNWRVDPRIDVLDIVRNENNYNWQNVRMTKTKLAYNGGFKGTGEGRVVLYD